MCDEHSTSAAALFAYRNMEPRLRQQGQARFKSAVRKSRLKLWLISMLPGKTGRMPPRTPLGYAGLFEDHVILTFDKPAGLSSLPP